MHAQLQHLLILLFFLLLNLTLRAQSDHPIPLNQLGHNYGKSEEEKKIFEESEESHAKLDFYGHILEDSSLHIYLNELAQKLKPAELDSFNIQVSVIKDYTINAGMYANGRMHINTGILAEFENEAQLAFVMCHELAHFINRHSLIKGVIADSINSANQKKIFKSSAERGIASFYEFSREVEMQADSLGFELYLKQNYPPIEAVKSLEKLPPRIKVDLPFIFGDLIIIRYTHPKNQTRINYIKRRVEPLSDEGFPNTNVYLQKTQGLSKLNIDLLIQQGGFLQSIYRLDSLKANISDTSSYYYQEITLTQGELYQKFLADPHVAEHYYNQKEIIEKEGVTIKPIGSKKATKYFEQYRPQLEEKTIYLLKPFLNNADFEHRANRALGLFYYQKHFWMEAKTHLSKYLETDKNIKDRRYIKSLISKIK